MANEWTLCSEDQPKVAGKYLVTWYDYFDGWVTTIMPWADGWNRTPDDDGKTEVSRYVRAWMDLPKPLKPERREG